jgi:hypothetical protein
MAISRLIAIKIAYTSNFRYTSKFKSHAKDDLNRNKADHRTMGHAKVPTRAPTEFLKGHEHEPVLPESE